MKYQQDTTLSTLFSKTTDIYLGKFLSPCLTDGILISSYLKWYSNTLTAHSLVACNRRKTHYHCQGSLFGILAIFE